MTPLFHAKECKSFFGKHKRLFLRGLTLAAIPSPSCCAQRDRERKGVLWAASYRATDMGRLTGTDVSGKRLMHFI